MAIYLYFSPRFVAWAALQIVKIYENLQKTKKRQKPLFYAFTRLLGLYLRYQLWDKIQMVGRTQRVFYAVADTLERIAAGFAVKMAVYHPLHAVLLEYLRKAAWRPFLVEWGVMQHDDDAAALFCSR